MTNISDYIQLVLSDKFKINISSSVKLQEQVGACLRVGHPKQLFENAASETNACQY